MTTPIISVIMPVYNAEDYLKESIDSVLKQTFSNFEFIILNDGSTDKSEEIILSYDEPRIRYIKNETNLQIVKTLNKGISLARGDYIARMDADDISLSHRLEIQLKFMKDNPDTDLCGSWVQIFGQDEGIWKSLSSHENIKAELLFNSPIYHPSILAKSSFFNTFKYSLDFNKAEDYFLWISAIDSHRLANIPEALLMYRLHNSQTDKVHQKKLTNELRSIMLKRLGCTLNEEQMNYFYCIADYQSISIDKFNIVAKELIRANYESKYFSTESLDRALAVRFRSIVKSNPTNGLRALSEFYKSPLRQAVDFKLFDYLKFISKCLIRWGKC